MSAHLVVMSIEGVLVEGQDLKTGLPSQAGLSLYNRLVGGYSIILVTQHDRGLVDTWLRKEGIRNFATVLDWASSNQVLSFVEWKALQVRTMLQTDAAVAWYIDTDPAAIERVYLEGVPTMMLSSPRFTRPEFRPDAERRVRPWNELVTTIESDRLLKAAKEPT